MQVHRTFSSLLTSLHFGWLLLLFLPPPAFSQTDPAITERQAREEIARRGKSPRPPRVETDLRASMAQLADGAPLAQGFALYYVGNNLNAHDAKKIPLAELPLLAPPALTDADLAGCDWTEQEFRLKPDVIDRLPKKVGLRGLPFVAVADGERIYTGGFWIGYSSVSPVFPHISVWHDIRSLRYDGIKQPDTIWIDGDWGREDPDAPKQDDEERDPRLRAALEKAGVPMLVSSKQPDADWLKSFRATATGDPQFPEVAENAVRQYVAFLNAMDASTDDDLLYRTGYANFLEREFPPKMSKWAGELAADKGSLAKAQKHNSLVLQTMDTATPLLYLDRYPSLAYRYAEVTTQFFARMMDAGEGLSTEAMGPQFLKDFAACRAEIDRLRADANQKLEARKTALKPG